jgi:hypothetical protein
MTSYALQRTFLAGTCFAVALRAHEVQGLVSSYSMIITVHPMKVRHGHSRFERKN